MHKEVSLAKSGVGALTRRRLTSCIQRLATSMCNRAIPNRCSRTKGEQKPPSSIVRPGRIRGCTMATVTPTSVKDVPKDKFIAAYAEHLKANDKVRLQRFGRGTGLIGGLCRAPRSLSLCFVHQHDVNVIALLQNLEYDVSVLLCCSFNCQHGWTL